MGNLKKTKRDRFASEQIEKINSIFAENKEVHQIIDLAK